MKNLTRHIPNLLTLGNLLCGTAGVIAVFRYDIFVATVFIWIGSVFDFLDGFSARMFKAYSDTGKELDSLADMVTFGVLPSLVLFGFLSGLLGEDSWLPYFCLVTVIFSAMRLAKFNIDTGQKNIFTGLPTPANAFLLSGLPFLSGVPVMDFIGTPGFVIGAAVICSLLMVSPLKFLSLKFTGMKDPDNIYRYIIIIAAVLLIALMRTGGISLAMAFYMIISVFRDVVNARKMRASDLDKV